MPFPIKEDFKPGQRTSAVPIADTLNTLAAIVNYLDGKAGAILLTKSATGKGWTLAVVPDGTSLEIKGGAVGIRMLGVSTDKLAGGCVTEPKIADGAVTGAKLGARSVDASKTVGLTGNIPLASPWTMCFVNGLLIRVA